MRNEAILYAVREWHLNLDSVLDMGCGGLGRQTSLLLEYGAGRVEGADRCVAVGRRYVAATGRPFRHLSFEDIVAGRLPPVRYSLVLCSFSLQFVGLSILPSVLTGLRRLTPILLVVGRAGRPAVEHEAWSLAATRMGLNGTLASLFRQETLMA